VTLTDALFDDSLPGSTDFRIWNGGSRDLEVRFVRVVKRDPPSRPPRRVDGRVGP
jgi:hypothetical protein